MKKSEKEEIVSQIKELLSNSDAMYLVDYKGINVEDMTQIRKEFRGAGITYKVFKNTLFKKAAQQIGGYEKCFDELVGMTGYAFVKDNIIAPAKIIQKCNKATEKLNFKGCFIDSQFYGSNQLDTLASMPGKEEIMASIVGSIAAPASGIVGALNSVIRDLVSVIDEVAKKKAA